MKLVSRFAEAIGWYPKSMPPEERRLVVKIDLLVLVYACLAFFTKYLDVSALTNAYVSGMKTDLDLTGNRLNYVNAAYEVGYCVFQIPSNMILTKVPAQYYLPAFEVAWGLFTLGTAFVTNYRQLVVMRFFVGLCATSCYIGCVHILNCWYRKSELGRRNALFWISNPLGTMFAGYLQAAAYNNLDKAGGLAGWRWLFIICTIITIPVAIIGVVFFPDTPEKTKTRWLTDAEKVLARSRVEQDGFRVSLGINKTLWKRVFMRWEFYFFASIGTIFWTSLYGYGTPFVLWLNSQPDKYSVATVNNLGTITSAVSAVSALVVAFYVDIRGKRWEPAIFAGFVALFCNLVLAIWHIPVGLKFFSYIAMGAAVGVGPLLVTWTADALADDLEVRAITIATYNAFGEMMGLVVPLVAWPVSHAPTFRGGFIWSTCLSAVYITVAGVIIFLQHRKSLKKQASEEDSTEEPPMEVIEQIDLSDSKNIAK